jgi:hypothetical protein
LIILITFLIYKLQGSVFNRSSDLGDSCAHVFAVMSRIIWYYLFNTLILFGVLFYLFFVLFVSGHYYLDTLNFGNRQDLQEEDFE